MAHEHQQDIQAWLDFARMDYDAAKTLFEHHPRPCEIICYHCQQAAEKAIKALFIFFDIPGSIPRKHDLSFLLNQLRNKTDISKEQLRQADTLSVYGVICRYPSEIQIDEERTGLALQHAEAFLRWATALTGCQ